MKTAPTTESVEQFLATITDEQRQSDCFDLLEALKEVTQEKPTMWGEGIIGFGSYHYDYGLRRQGDWCLTGFSTRQKALTVYINIRPDDFTELVQQLGKCTLGTSCIYFVKLSDIHLPVLKEIITKSITMIKKVYPS